MLGNIPCQPGGQKKLFGPFGLAKASWLSDNSCINTNKESSYDKKEEDVPG